MKIVGGALAGYYGSQYLAGGMGGSSAASVEAPGAVYGTGSTAPSTVAGSGTDVLSSSLGWLGRNSGGLGVLGGAASAYGQYQANQQNMELGREQMAFQERMSSTAYQRATADMMAAGLNPMLGYSQGGASSPGGAMPQVANSLGPAISSAADAAQKMASVQLLQEQSRKTQSETTDQDLKNNFFSVLQTDLAAARTKQAASSAKQAEASAAQLEKAKDLLQVDLDVRKPTVPSQQQKIQYEGSRTQSEAEIAHREAEFAKTDFGQLAPLLKLIRYLVGPSVSIGK